MICDGGDNRMGKKFAHPTVEQVVIVKMDPEHLRHKRLSLG